MSDQNKDEQIKQHEELAKGLADINNSKSPGEILTEQVVAGRDRSRSRDKERRRFFGE